MKALSIKQPWVTLIANGIKTLEVRTRRTSHRGPLVIVSSKEPNRAALQKFSPEDAPNGVTIALVDPTGKFVWEMRVIRKLPAIPTKGRLGFYELPEGVAKKCRL
jgi:hypothetical protein